MDITRVLAGGLTGLIQAVDDALFQAYLWLNASQLDAAMRVNLDVLDHHAHDHVDPGLGGLPGSGLGMDHSWGEISDGGAGPMHDLTGIDVMTHHDTFGGGGGGFGSGMPPGM
jgi:hypothetical protein